MLYYIYDVTKMCFARIPNNYKIKQYKAHFPVINYFNHRFVQFHTFPATQQYNVGTCVCTEETKFRTSNFLLAFLTCVRGNAIRYKSEI